MRITWYGFGKTRKCPPFRKNLSIRNCLLYIDAWPANTSRMSFVSHDIVSDLSLAVSFSEVDVVAVGAVHVEVDLPDVGREPPRQAPHLLQVLMQKGLKSG